MPSNRSKKDIFQKIPDDTLKRQLISSEFRKHAASKLANKKVTNGTDALQLLSSNSEYIKLEEHYNAKLASYIQDLRFEMANKIDSGDLSIPTLSSPSEHEINAQTFSQNGKMELEKIKKIEKISIPEENFSAYWKERLEWSSKLDKYCKLLVLPGGTNRDECHGDEIQQSIILYVQTIYSIIRKKHGSPVPIKCIKQRHYDTVCKVYNTNKSRGLDFYKVPNEYIITGLMQHRCFGD